MPRELLSMGGPSTLLVGIIYALPAVIVRVSAVPLATGLIDLSDDGVIFYSSGVAAGTASEFITAASFIKATTAGAVVTIKRA